MFVCVRARGTDLSRKQPPVAGSRESLLHCASPLPLGCCQGHVSVDVLSGMLFEYLHTNSLSFPFHSSLLPPQHDSLGPVLMHRIHLWCLAGPPKAQAGHRAAPADPRIPAGHACATCPTPHGTECGGLAHRSMQCLSLRVLRSARRWASRWWASGVLGCCRVASSFLVVHMSWTRRWSVSSGAGPVVVVPGQRPPPSPLYPSDCRAPLIQASGA